MHTRYITPHFCQPDDFILQLQKFRVTNLVLLRSLGVPYSKSSSYKHMHVLKLQSNQSPQRNGTAFFIAKQQIRMERNKTEAHDGVSDLSRWCLFTEFYIPHMHMHMDTYRHV